MAIEDDIARPLPDGAPDGILPEPPPPNPARRQAAIDAALRRFDGADERPAPARPGASGPPWWTQLGRPQLGALVSIALIAVIGVPVAMISLGDPHGPMSVLPPPAVNAPAPQPAGSIADSAPPTAIAPPPPAAPKSVAPPVLAQIPSVPTPAAQADSASCDTDDCAAAGKPGAVASPAQPAAPAMKVARDDAMPSAVVAQSSRAEQLDRRGSLTRTRLAENRFAAAPIAVAPPAPPPPAEMAAETGVNEIVVTGMRRAAPVRSVGRGDWNACTVNDPNRSLAACRKLVDPAAKGPAGRAAARLADGLSQAWQGDLDGAIAAFDQAIAIDPRQSLAYLNRGLAYQQSGDLDRAIADLDRAVKYGRGSARGYYNRSVLLRQRGDTRRATADENRAVSLDLRYQAVVR